MIGAAAQTTAPACSSLALNSLLAELGQIDATTLKAPTGLEKCPHWTKAGVAGDGLKRLIGLRATVIDSLRHENRAAAAVKARLDKLLSHPDLGQMESLLDRMETIAVSAAIKTRKLQLISILIEQETRLQFPELADQTEVDIDEDWNVGWTDHERLHEEIESFLRSGKGLLGSIGIALSGFFRPSGGPAHH